MPIAECLSCGAYVFTPDTSWAMAWRLDDVVQIHGPGKLADCFVVYDGQQGLQEKLRHFKTEYDLKRLRRYNALLDAGEKSFGA